MNVTHNGLFALILFPILIGLAERFEHKLSPYLSWDQSSLDASVPDVAEG